MTDAILPLSIFPQIKEAEARKVKEVQEDFGREFGPEILQRPAKSFLWGPMPDGQTFAVGVIVNGESFTFALDLSTMENILGGAIVALKSAAEFRALRTPEGHG